MQTEWRKPNSFPYVLVSPEGSAVYAESMKPVKFHDNGKGYLQIHTTRNGKQYMRYIHRLVAECYLDNPKGLREVNHIDGNKQNNSVENLEWCTTRDNHLHAYKTGLKPNTTPKQREAAKKNVHKSYKAKREGWLRWSKTEAAKKVWMKNLEKADRWKKKGA